jgi:hypothetical protein
MKMLLFIPGFLASAFLSLSAISDAAPLRGGARGRGIRSGFATRHAGLQERGFFHRDHHVFFQPYIWPSYWYPYADLNDYSYLYGEPDDTYQYWDNSIAPGQVESSRPATDRGPIVVIVKAGNSGTAETSQNPGYVTSGYSSTASAGQRKIVVQDPNETTGPPADPSTVVPQAVPQTPQAVARGTQTGPPAKSGPFGNYVLVSWLEEAGKDVIYVQNIDTHDVQKITSEPNLDNFRIVELRRNTDPKLFEAVISNGSQQGPVRFRF